MKSARGDKAKLARLWSFVFARLYSIQAKAADLGSRALAFIRTKLATAHVIIPLALAVVVLIFAVGGVHNWYKGSGRDSTLAAVTWHLVWITYSLCLLALVCLLSIAAYDYITHRSSRSKRA